MKPKNFWDVKSNIRNRVAKAKSSGNDGTGNGQESSLVPQNDDDADKLARDLSLGGAVLLGLGAKQLLLPALCLSHPLLLAVTVPTTVVTGRRYLRSLWDAATGNGDLNTEAVAGTATVVSLVSGGSVTALAGVGMLNLGKYLTHKGPISLPAQEEEGEPNQPPLPSSSHPFTHYAVPASLALGGLIFASHFIRFMPTVGFSLALTNQLITSLRTTPYAPLLYITTYSVRPMALPASLLTIAGGMVFGPFWGVLYSIVGSNISAIVGYVIGRYLGEGLVENKIKYFKNIKLHVEDMRKNPFESVLIMRFLFLPYDLVNYLAGALQIEWQPFLLATILGSLPGTFSFVLLGASLEGNAITGISRFNPSTLAASGVIFVSSLAFSRYLKDLPDEEEEESVTGQLGLA